MRPQSSRKESASVLRGSTSTRRRSPLTVRATASSSTTGLLEGAGRRRGRRDALPRASGTTATRARRRRVRVGGGEATDLLCVDGRGIGPDQRGLGVAGPHGGRAHAEQRRSRPARPARRRRGARRPPRRRGRSRRRGGRTPRPPTRTVPVQTGKRTAVSTSAGSRHVVHVETKNSAAGTVRTPAGPRDDELGVEREGDGGQLRRRVGVGDRPADRAPVADLEVPDQRNGPSQQRHGSDLGGALDLRLTGHGARPPRSRRPV